MFEGGAKLTGAFRCSDAVGKWFEASAAIRGHSWSFVVDARRFVLASSADRRRDVSKVRTNRDGRVGWGEGG